MTLISLRIILWIIWSYISYIRPSMPAFGILIKLKLRILINLVIKSLIVNTIGLGIRVPIHSLIRRPIGGINDCSFY
jgi:hypothetical protein